MKMFYIILIAVFMISGASAQSCLPDGITFSTQAGIDGFQTNYPGCTQIEGRVIIGSQSGSDITNLNGLNVLTSIGGSLIIGGTNLVNLSGLDNLTSIGGDLQTYIFYSYPPSPAGNDSLASFTGLNNLTSIGGKLIISYNVSLTTLSGLDNISAGSIIDLQIWGNPLLSTCEVESICEYLASPNGSVDIYYNAPGCNNPPEIAAGCGITLPCLPYGNYKFFTQADIDNFPSDYPGCTTLGGDVAITGNDIINLDSLNMITSVEGNLDIDLTSNLTSFSGLEGLTSLGGYLNIHDNSAITSLAGLEGLTSIGGYLNIHNNAAITSLAGLDNLTSVGTDIGDYLLIGPYNDALINLNGLNNLSTISGYLHIMSNGNLKDITGLNNLTSIGAGLVIFSNPALTSLSGLDNIDAGSIISLEIDFNDSLSTCAVQSICGYIASPDAIVEIHNNETGCNSKSQVQAACEVGLDESAVSSWQSAVNIYPNPASNAITISTPTTTLKNTHLTIYNINGQVILSRQITEQQTVVDVSGLSQGVYFVKVADNRTVQVEKFVKQ
jgi:hypothetical protein